MVDADQPAGVIGVEYLVRYRTRLADLTQARDYYGSNGVVKLICLQLRF